MTVSDAAVVSIDVSPATTVVPAGYTRQYRAVATYSDASTRDVTTEVTWSSSDTAIATISNATGTQGVATGVAASGTPVEIAASLARPSGTPAVGTAELTVTSATLQSIAVSPATFTVARRATTALAAIGTFSGGLTLEITRQCAWSSSSRGVATVSKSGIVTGVGIGSVTIRAKKGNKQGTASGTVY